MLDGQKEYKLKFELFMGQNEYRSLISRLDADCEWSQSLEIEHVEIREGRYSMGMEGSLVDLDECHRKLRGEYFEELRVICVNDQAGDYLRELAFPILSRLEQRLRTFVNRIMFEGSGPKWWDRWASKGNQDSVKDRSPGYYIHPLEALDFGDLLKLLQHKYCDWSTHGPSSLKELCGMFCEADSFDSLRERFSDMLRMHSVWEEVCAIWFPDKAEWKVLKGSLESLIRARNSVMHHKPFFLEEYNKLVASENQANSILDKTLGKLNKTQERELAEKTEAFNKHLEQAIVSNTDCNMRVDDIDRFEVKNFVDVIRQIISLDEMSKTIRDATRFDTATFNDAIREHISTKDMSKTIGDSARFDTATFNDAIRQIISAADMMNTMRGAMNPSANEFTDTSEHDRPN